MRSLILTAALAALLAAAEPAAAHVSPFPPSFRSREVATNGATLHVRAGGQGPAVVMLHGFGETGDTWAPLAAALAARHRVIVIDLRGMGLSSHPADGYSKVNQAEDVAGVLDTLGVSRADLVAHDIGNMVAYAFAARHPERVRRVVLIDAPIPGLGDWAAYSHNPRVWHWYFHGPDEERLVAGRERIYLDRFWNELSYKPASIDEATREHYARLYALPGAMHAAFEQFAAFPADADDNLGSFAKTGKLGMPVLAVGGDHSYGTRMADVANAAFSHTQLVVIPNAGHWLMDEAPEPVIEAVGKFLDAPD
jgi:pimeloyl-ACP methyl ester carboxylesterase